MDTPADAPQPPVTPQDHWEERYGVTSIWSGRVNATTAAVVEALEQGGAAPGRSLDLGSGEGADVIWLAARGWDATGVDISTRATERARIAAIGAGVPEERIRFVAADLSAWADGAGTGGAGTGGAGADGTRPVAAADDPAAGLLDGPFDLVTASFFHSEVELARTAVLRRAAEAIAVGGHLLIVSHAAPPPWAAAHDAAEHGADGAAADGNSAIGADGGGAGGDGADGDAARYGDDSAAGEGTGHGHAPGHGHHDLLTPAEEVAALALPADAWAIEIAESRERAATGPDGESAVLEDGVVLLRRLR